MEDILSVSTPGVDASALVASIRKTIERKTAEGWYNDAIILRAERANLLTMKGDEDFLEFFLRSLRLCVFVDIGDMEIHEKRRFFAGFFVKLKKAIWALLRFYTYRLWSQQNQANGMFVTAFDVLLDQNKAREKELLDRIKMLEKRIEKLEGGTDGRP